MNKYIIALGLSLFLLSCGNTEVKPASDTVAPKPSPIETPKEVPAAGNTEEKLSTTMEEIFKKGTASTCTFTSTENGQTMNGTLYTDSGKMRYSMGFVVQGQNTTNDMITNDTIIEDGYSYYWSNMQSWKGFKIKDAPAKEWYALTKGDEERNKKIDFTCKSGVPAGIFDLPADVKFGELDMSTFPDMPKSAK